ncbi:MAG: Glucokinase [Tenericutes bacterium ADurb.BinA155]|nr:MAG: Glucokinase [Tenericutes bacterium ADurb.BinA155]
MDQIISLDIGGTNTRCALIDASYQVKNLKINPTVTGTLQGFLDSVAAIIKEVVPVPQSCKAIAIGVPGRVRYDGYIYALPNIHIEAIPLASYLHDLFKIPVYVKNDAEVAALAESNVGPYKKYRSLFFITISTGVGGALCVDGKLRNSSYEVGHTLMECHGEIHEAEHMLSGAYLTRLAKANGVEIENAHQFFDLVKAKDPKILPTYHDWIALLAEFIQMNQDNFEPDIFTLTGGVMKSADVFFLDLQKACPHSHLEKCAFDQEAGLIGAAVYGFQKTK